MAVDAAAGRPNSRTEQASQAEFAQFKQICSEEEGWELANDDKSKNLKVWTKKVSFGFAVLGNNLFLFCRLLVLMYYKFVLKLILMMFLWKLSMTPYLIWSMAGCATLNHYVS